MQATFELSGEILERLRQESARSGRPASALVEAALQTALPAPAGAGDASATLPSDAPADNAAPAESDAAVQPRPPLNLPSWDMGQPAVDFSNRDELERALYDDEKSRRRYGFSLYPDTESADAPDAPDANAAPDAAQPRPPLNLPSSDLGQSAVDVSNQDKPYRMLDDARYWKFAESPDQAGEVPAPETSAAPPDAAADPQSRPPLNLPSWDMGQPSVDVSNREELERALYDDEKFRRRYGFSLYPDTEEKE